jgi:hypothetical protein
VLNVLGAENDDAAHPAADAVLASFAQDRVLAHRKDRPGEIARHDVFERWVQRVRLLGPARDRPAVIRVQLANGGEIPVWAIGGQRTQAASNTIGR